ncbi:LysR substrate-binding domain-containing protein [Photobacterium sp. 1_MG-2023]|uniref:LysR substrate-binding domain-containing protein n=1 Tax=Photobacterium sp. 1_MG-2023 TaxID=3062646 RepID=UPI0026E1A599|nr:LysR substrate-binding domain-containing protein [Photobacterium sp. 1_MG-2023]MDO6708617.1 LysR substrate-binding domain-containing protein [Photobacterium sp. 1_MG-2023]
MDNRLQYLSGLRYFEAAARRQSYSKAAEELFVSQAAVSQKIRQLEESLGCKLFYRQGRNMMLTPQGSSLFTDVSRGFDQILAGLNRIQAEPLEGILTVNTSRSFASRWLMPRLWKFTMIHPDISIRVDATAENPDMKYGRADLAIRQGFKNDFGDGIQSCILYEEPVYPLCSPELAHSIKFTHPEQLLKCWLVHWAETCNLTWARWFEAADVHMPERNLQWMEVSTFEMGLNAVMAGHGACLGTLSLAGDYLDNGLLVQPFDIGLVPGIRYTLFYDPTSPRMARAQAFIDWLKQEVSLLQTERALP